MQLSNQIRPRPQEIHQPQVHVFVMLCSKKIIFINEFIFHSISHVSRSTNFSVTRQLPSEESESRIEGE